MENASKALIIAGAILLSILIIAIGMYIYNSSQNSIQTAGSQISAQEVSSFNQTWEMYEGTQTGSNVKALISKLSANATQNAEENTRLPDLYYEPTAQHASNGAQRGTCAVINVRSNINNIRVQNFNTARTQIEARHTYRVTLVTNNTTGLVSGVIITYNPDSDATKLSVYRTLANDR